MTKKNERICKECEFCRETGYAIHPFACIYTVLWPKKIVNPYESQEWCPLKKNEVQEKSTEQEGS